MHEVHQINDFEFVGTSETQCRSSAIYKQDAYSTSCFGFTAFHFAPFRKSLQTGNFYIFTFYILLFTFKTHSLQMVG